MVHAGTKKWIWISILIVAALFSTKFVSVNVISGRDQGGVSSILSALTLLMALDVFFWWSLYNLHLQNHQQWY